MSEFRLDTVLEGPSTRRRRRTSLTSQFSNSSSRFVDTPAFPTRPNSLHSDAGSDIYSPTPRRHHIQSSETRRWLDAQPPASRPTSPLALRSTSEAANTTTHTAEPPSPLTRRRRGERLQSLSTFRDLRDPLKEKEREREGAGGMGRRWVRWMHEEGFKDWVVPCAVAVALLVKWCVGLGSYSGQNTPPMFGDYEAQRHWMELTIHLPVAQWYTYDLPYWGLDYPPLTAYVSWICGIIGSRMNSTWFALDASRGIETEGSKLFMRASVLATDSLVYVPALVMFTRVWHAQRSKRTQNLALLLLLFHPALLVIDFGHFQYNSVMLGFTVLALNFFATGHDLIGAVCFVLSLGFKQMALYYAPAIGAYLIGKCLYLGPNHGSQLFVRLAVTTTLAFLLLFSPFLPPLAPPRAILDPLTRIFPFARGLFEDKVANFWCASDVVLKWRRWLSKPALVRLAALLTAAGFAPAAAGLVYSGYALRARAREDWTRARSPTLPLLHYALFTSSMSFFLFSFQVHEKTILLPLLPLTLLLSGSAPESATFQWGVLVNNVAMFSMWPLLKRDGLGVQYIALLALWNRLIGYNPLRKPESPLQYLSIVVFAGCAALHVLELVMAPPARYPDLFPVLNVLLSTPVFGLAWLWSIKRGVEVSWAMGGLGGARAEKEEREDGVAPLEKMQDGVKTLRQSGARTQSLGFAYAAQGRKRAAFRTASVDLGVDAGASASASGGDLR